jgi:hypothetical protein
MKKRLKNVIGLLVIAVVGLLFYRSFSANIDNLEGVSLRPDFLIACALILFVLQVIVMGYSWGRITIALTKVAIPPAESIKIQLASWLLKYIPGQAGSFLNKVAWAKQRKIDGKKIAASFIYENAYLLLASVITSVPILLITASDKFSEGSNFIYPLIFGVPLALLLTTPQIFNRVINILFKFLKKKRLSDSELLSSKDNLKFTLGFIIPRIINGAAFVLIAASVVGIGPSLYLTFGAIYVLAGLLGVLAIFVPSGLGVREAVIVLFASAYIPTEQAIVLSLLTRFYATAADILIAVLYSYLRVRGSKT